MADNEPSDQDIKDLMRKTEKKNSQGKTSPKQPPKDKVPWGTQKEYESKTGKGLTEETISSRSSNQEEPKDQGKTSPKETPDPGTKVLHQRLSVLEADISAIKELVKAAVAQGEKTQGKTPQTQTKTKTTDKEETDQEKEQEELTTEEEMALLDKARREKTKKEGGPEGEGPPSKDALVYLTAKLLDSTTKTVVAFFQSKAAGGTGEEDPFTKFSKEFTMKSMEGVVAAQTAQRSADVITPATLRAVSDLFGAIGKLPKPAAQKITESGRATEEIL